MMKVTADLLKKFISESIVNTRCVVSSPPDPTKVRKTTPIMRVMEPPNVKAVVSDLSTPPYLMSLDSCLYGEDNMDHNTLLFSEVILRLLII